MVMVIDSGVASPENTVVSQYNVAGYSQNAVNITMEKTDIKIKILKTRYQKSVNIFKSTKARGIVN
jgi:hypothetical protein